ncbi:MAG: methyltransferase domain-containing protein, partial [Acidimicrobiales bacterium]
FIMLHHVIDWEQTLAEVERVLRPGGLFAGYDLVQSGPAKLLHRLDRSPHHLVTVTGLRGRLGDLDLQDVDVTLQLGRLVARFAASKSRHSQGALR